MKQPFLGLKLFLGTTGAFTLWMFSGFKASFNGYLEEDRLGKAYWTGFATICALVFVVVLGLKIFNIPFSDLQKPINPVK
jgi:hypothetical protein